MLTKQVQALFRALNPGHAVDDHQAAVTLDDGQVGDVVVTRLIQAVDDLVQATLLDQLGLPPQARVHRVRRRGIVSDVLVVILVEDDMPIGADYLPAGEGRDEPTVRISEILPVIHVIPRNRRVVRRDSRGRGVLRRVGHTDLPVCLERRGTALNPSLQTSSLAQRHPPIPTR